MPGCVFRSGRLNLTFDGNFKYFIEPHIPGFAEFEKWNGKRVVEIGCGLNKLTTSLLEKF